MKKSLFALVTVLATGRLPAATVEVSTLSALAAAIEKASPGDRILLANGTYASKTPSALATATALFPRRTSKCMIVRMGCGWFSTRS